MNLRVAKHDIFLYNFSYYSYTIFCHLISIYALISCLNDKTDHSVLKSVIIYKYFHIAHMSVLELIVWCSYTDFLFGPWTGKDLFIFFCHKPQF